MTPTEKLRHLVSDITGARLDQIADDSHFVNDLGCDVLDLWEITMAAEDEFHIEISDDQAEGAKTFGTLVRLVDELTGVAA